MVNTLGPLHLAHYSGKNIHHIASLYEGLTPILPELVESEGCSLDL